MKNLIVFILLSVFIISCGTHTGDPNIDNISFGEAWKHVSGYASYWVWLFLSIIPSVVYILYLVVDKDSQLSLPIAFVCLAIFAFGMLYAPAECATNTTIEQAARGVFIR